MLARTPRFPLICAGIFLSVMPRLRAETPAQPKPQPAPEIFAAPQTLRSDEVTLIWDKFAGASAPVVYEVLCEGHLLGSTAKTHFTAKNLTPAHDYLFTVRTQPVGSRVSPQSKELHITTRAKEQTLSVEEFGAKGDGTTLNTKAIQAAIDACPTHGAVVIPRGVFLSGALWLKSNMTLFIAAGGVLKGSASPADYEPFYLNRFEGWELKTYASLLNAGKMDHAGPCNVHNLSIRGEGTISGGGDALGKAMIAANDKRSRGRLICLMNCSDVEVQGLTLTEPPCWTLHYIYCEDVTLHDLTINTQVRNGDGMDPDSSRNSYIFNCSFSTGDDCIAIKSGKNPEGNIINRPTENVRIFDCRFTAGHGISIGSEISGGVRNVLIEDCVAGNLLNGLQIKGTKDRGSIVENITVQDCNLQKITVLTTLNYNNDGDPAPTPPVFQNFVFRNIDLSAAKASSAVVIVDGFSKAGHRTRNVTFENLKLPASAIIDVDQSEDVSFAGIATADGTKPTYKITHSERVTY